MARETGAAWSLTARWVVPVDQPPLERGIVTIAGERIVAVEPDGARPADHDLGNVVIFPGLVNAHTHLDLSGFEGETPPTHDFVDWLKCVIQHRRSMTPWHWKNAVGTGVCYAMSSGTTTLGDIASQGYSWEGLGQAPLRVVVFHEFLGLPSERVVSTLAMARSWLESHPATPTRLPGLSPHAPFSVHRDLYRGLTDLAREFNVPLATHLAETSEEMLLLSERRGPFVDFLKELNVWDESGLASSPSEVLQLCNHAAPLLIAHGNYLPADSPISSSASLVYCPRTHAAFGHEPYPLPRLLREGVRVALGTDSLASNPDLDIRAEAALVQRLFPALSHDQILRMITLSGAEALGCASDAGSLTPGKAADLVVAPLRSGYPYASIFDATKTLRVMFGGEWTVNR